MAARVSRGIVGPEDHVFDITGFMLTASQILRLREEKNLTAHGIHEFAKKVEDEAKKR